MRIDKFDIGVYHFPVEPYSDATRTMWAREVIVLTVRFDTGVDGVGVATGLCTTPNLQAGQETFLVRHLLQSVIAPMAIGHHINDRTAMMSTLYRQTVRFGQRGLTTVALGLLDQALWDALGKKAGLSVAALLGRARDAVPAYVTVGSLESSAEELVVEVDAMTERGFSHIKVKIGAFDVRREVARLEAICDRAAKPFELMVDVNEGWSLSDYLTFQRMAGDLPLYWVEEPMPVENVLAYSRVSPQTRFPVAIGDYQMTHLPFLDYLRNTGVTHFHADATRVGGITEWMKVAALAEPYGVSCSAHAMPEVHVHTLAAAPNGGFLEYYDDDHPTQSGMSRLYPEPRCLKSVRNGLVDVPDTPGFGRTMDEDFAMHHAIDY